MTMTATDTLDPGALKSQAETLFQRKRLTAFGMLALVCVYLLYAFISFDVSSLLRSASPENGATLLRDTYSYKTHITRDNRSGEVTYSIEGERRGQYPEGRHPDYVTESNGTVITDLGDGHVVTYTPEGGVRYDIPGYGLVSALPGRSGVAAEFPDGPLPDWINASKNRVTIVTDAGRLTVTRNRTEVFAYAFGWELFFFTLDSPYHGLGLSALIARATSGEAAAIWQDFWHNPMWHHSDVAWALFETVLMAFLGTFGAALVALPLAFLAAKGFTPLLIVRQAFRRLFDLFRGVDALIWTVLLSRAFGPGPMTGALAILVTDTGSFGKMFSEALENIDEKQIEGLRSTGAKPLQRYRFGVLPQVTPVLLSQILYFFESNTRSATVIGAITGGGIGLLLTQAIITQKDWEEVTYYIVLVILLVIAMDWLSGKIRQRLIRGSAD